MKGISTILATILIVIIVVALVSLTYTFAVGLFSTSTSGATAGTQALNKRLQQSVEFVGASCGATSGNISFTIRNSGTIAMAAGDLTALIGSPITTIPLITAATLDPGEVKSFIYQHGTGYTPGQSITVTVSAPAGTVDKSITCS